LASRIKQLGHDIIWLNGLNAKEQMAGKFQNISKRQLYGAAGV